MSQDDLERSLLLGRLFLQAGMAVFLLLCFGVGKLWRRWRFPTFESGLLLGAQVLVAFALLLETVGEGERGFPLKQLLAFVAPWWLAYVAMRLFHVRGDRSLLPLACYLTGMGWVEILRLDYHLGTKQVLWTWVGLFLFTCVCVALRDYQRLAAWRLQLLGVAVVLQLGVLVFGVERNGARLWYAFGNLLFQPVEIVKVLAVLVLAAYLLPLMQADSQERIPRKTLALFALSWAAIEALLALQKDLGMALLFFGVFLAMFFVATGRIRWVLAILGLFGAGAAAGYLLFPHVRTRVLAWWDPLNNFESSGYQISQALFALAWGGPWGVGLGRGEPYRIPEAATDFIFVAFAEEMGGVGAALLLGALAMLVYRAFSAALHNSDYGRLLATGLGTLLAWQSLIMVGGTVKVMPMTGITLPFVSYGGSSLV